MSFVYLISEGDWGPVKVGVAKNPHGRIKELQTGNPKPLRLARCWEMDNRFEAFAIERAVLDEMSPYRMEGEWIEADELGMIGLVAEHVARVWLP